MFRLYSWTDWVAFLESVVIYLTLDIKLNFFCLCNFNTCIRKDWDKIFPRFGISVRTNKYNSATAMWCFFYFLNARWKLFPICLAWQVDLKSTLDSQKKQIKTYFPFPDSITWYRSWYHASECIGTLSDSKWPLKLTWMFCNKAKTVMEEDHNNHK